MKRTIYFIVAFFVLIFSNCDPGKPEPAFVENTELRNLLQGSWIDKNINGGLGGSMINFNQDTLSWKDSTFYEDYINGSHIQVIKGNCPVMYAFNDSIWHYNPDNYNYYRYPFPGINNNNILWIMRREGEMRERTNYKVINNEIILDEIVYSPYGFPRIPTSYVIFSQNSDTVKFYYSEGKYHYSYVRQ